MNINVRGTLKIMVGNNLYSLLRSDVNFNRSW